MTARNLIDSPRRLVLLLAICTCVTYPRTSVLALSGEEEEDKTKSEIMIPNNDLMIENEDREKIYTFTGTHIKSKGSVIGRGESYCKDVMGGIEMVKHEEGGHGYLCKCEDGKYMAFFGMCMPMPWNNKVLVGRETAYSRLLPPANKEGLDDYSFFHPLTENGHASELYVAHAICLSKENYQLEMYDNDPYDRVCTCIGGYAMNQRGQCVNDCADAKGSNRDGDDSQYCWE